MWRGIGLVGTVIIGFLACIWTGTVSAKDIRFTAQEPVPDKLSWTPSQVTIDQKNDLKEPLYFILENSTNADHEFAVHGLFEEISEVQTSPRFGEYFTGPKTVKFLRPIHVLVKAKKTLKISVAGEGLFGDRNLGAKYLFFCPMHKEAHVGGQIIVD